MRRDLQLSFQEGYTEYRTLSHRHIFTVVDFDSECFSAHGHEASDGEDENGFEHPEIVNNNKRIATIL